jgi:hypothetical protein
LEHDPEGLMAETVGRHMLIVGAAAAFAGDSRATFMSFRLRVANLRFATYGRKYDRHDGDDAG